MADLKQQAQSLIDEMEVEEGVKQNLREMLEKDGVTPDFIVELRVATADAKTKLDQQYQPLLDQLKQLDEQEQAELGQAYKEFETEMNELEEDADALSKAIGEADEKEQMEEARSQIASQ